MTLQAIRNTPEFQRILAIPRRDAVPPLTDELTEVLRTPGGEQRLRPVQAQALQEIGTHGGLFGPIGVGEGKTLITLLAPYILDAKRPLLLLPAGLIEKTQRERAAYAKHWRVPTNLRLYSYEMLGRVQAAEEIETFQPDLIIGDEIHKLKNRRAACTRRVARWMHEHPETRFVALSGTVMRRSLLDFAHILRWCLKDGAPVPRTVEETEEWALALDDKISDEARFEAGVLLELARQSACTCEVCSALRSPGYTTAYGDLELARRGFQRRLLETPGVVSATKGETIDASIYVRGIPYRMSATTDEHVKTLRREMETPDGWELMSGAEVWMHTRQLALGFHSVWDPRPPQDWRDARRVWAAFVRDVLSRSRTLDSPEQVAQAVDDGRLDGKAELAEWRKARDLPREGGKPYVPNVVAVWHDDSALKVCLEWMKRPGLVWVEHVPFAERLARMAGTKYYGAGGLAADGEYIEDADGKRAIVISVDANKEGKNLQARWNRNLIVSPGKGADEWQQLIARTHRPGQQADEVEVDILLGCREHLDAWSDALDGARLVESTMGETQRLLLAEVLTWPSEADIAKVRNGGAHERGLWAIKWTAA